MSALATAYVQIIPSANGIKKQLTETLDNEMPSGSSYGQSFGGKFATAIKAAIAAAGIGEAIKSAISEGMDLEQNLGGTAAVFGDFAASIQKNAVDAYKNMGLSASDYMATANKMGSLFQGSGLEQQRAMDLTAAAMQRAADVASVMGLDMQAAMESIAGAAKGNFTMMDNLGVAMNATTLQAYALEKGINFEWNTASNAEKAELAMQMFFERTGQYAGNFARESEETLSGSMGAVKASLQNTLGNLALGADIGPSLTALKDTAVTFISGNFLPAVANVIGNLPGVIFDVVSAVGPEIASSGIAIVGGLIDGIATQGPQLLQTGVDAAVSLINGLASGVAENVQSFLGQAMPMLMEFSGQIRQNAGQLVDAGLNLIMELANGIIASIPTLVETIPTIVTNIAGIINDNAPKLLVTAATLIWNLVSGLIDAIPTIVENIPQIIDAIVSVIMAFNWIDLGKNIIGGLKTGIKKMAGQIKTAAANIKDNIVGAIKNLPSTLKSFASNAIGNIKNVFSGSGLKNIAANVFNGIKSAVSVGLSGAKNIAVSILNAIKAKFSSIFDGVKSLVKGGIDKIKSFFNFTWSLPKLKMPHFNISGKFSLNPPSAPKFSIKWYKDAMDNAMMLSSPTIFGMAGGTLLGAGEAGPEVVAGADTLLGMMRSAVEDSFSDQLTLVNANFDKLFAIMGQYYPQFAAAGVYLDSGVLVGKMAPAMDKALGRLSQQRGRGR